MKKGSKESIFVKFLRASFKQQYHKYKKDSCYVCGRTEELELHHNKPLAVIAREYCERHNIEVPSNDVVLRAKIFEECEAEICGSENLITLCKLHHKNIHSIFGKTYNTKVSEKVKKYLEKQKERLNG